MCRAAVVAFLCLALSSNAINRPVYKIVLTQKGYAQFLQYDVVTPPIREFTFCTWIRVYDLAKTQSIFTYVASGNDRIIRVWLDSGGQRIQISINGKVTSTAKVDVVKDVWRHICFSYQSDYGAWALYVDSRLVSCEDAKSLNGFVLPSGGSVIIGYETGANGESIGFEGEIFGVNMILSSTIERNYTLRQDPLYGQKRFPRNKIKHNSNHNNYVVLSDLLNEKIQNNFESSTLGKKSIKFQTPFGFVDHSIGLDSTTVKQQQSPSESSSKESFDFTVTDFMSTNQDKLDFWNTPKFEFTDMYKSQTAKAPEVLKSGTKIVPTVSEFETPPPPSNSFGFNSNDLSPPTSTKSIYNLDNETSPNWRNRHRELALVETPPPEEQDPKIYGQWSNSKFARNVLNYLRNTNFKNRDSLIKKTPSTIPLHKLSDSYPYPSDIRLHIVRPPSQFRRRKVVEKRYDVIRRDSQINVQILEDGLRNNIAKIHSETQPKQVEISHRGAARKRELRLPQYQKNVNSSSEDYQSPKTTSDVDYKENVKNHRYFPARVPIRPPSLKLPSAKSFENVLYDLYYDTQTSTEQERSKDSVNKSLDLRNKWHNAKSYNNDYTPRKFSSFDESDEIDEQKKIYPSVRLRYRSDPTKRKSIFDEEDLTILQGRKLASEVSNQSYAPKDTVSIYKYNHGFLLKDDVKKRMPAKRNMEPTNFDRNVKLGNALNERDVLGDNEEQKEQSFVGGNENIPDINKFRAEIEGDTVPVPPSLGPRVCKNAELYDRVLYVQPDGSIDMTHILSPVRKKNIAIEFVIQNYKKCSLAESAFQKNAMLLIDWSKTPVRLFGGAYPRTTTDLCGFF